MQPIHCDSLSYRKLSFVYYYTMRLFCMAEAITFDVNEINIDQEFQRSP